MKHGHNHTNLAKQILSKRTQITPSELADLIGCHAQKAASLLRSLGWHRVKQYNKPKVLYIRDNLKEKRVVFPELEEPW